MQNTGLSYNSRKALMVNIGEEAGGEIADLISSMAAEIVQLRNSKLDVSEIVPDRPQTVNPQLSHPQTGHPQTSFSRPSELPAKKRA